MPPDDDDIYDHGDSGDSGDPGDYGDPRSPYTGQPEPPDPELYETGAPEGPAEEPAPEPEPRSVPPSSADNDPEEIFQVGENRYALRRSQINQLAQAKALEMLEAQRGAAAQPRPKPKPQQQPIGVDQRGRPTESHDPRVSALSEELAAIREANQRLTENFDRMTLETQKANLLREVQQAESASEAYQRTVKGNPRAEKFIRQHLYEAIQANPSTPLRDIVESGVKELQELTSALAREDLKEKVRSARAFPKRGQAAAPGPRAGERLGSKHLYDGTTRKRAIELLEARLEERSRM